MESSLEQWLEELFSCDEQNGSMTEKQQRIIKAAVESFSEKGYAATSTSEIAQKAGVAEGTIFRHYKTKKELLIAITVPVITKMIEPLFLRDFTRMLDAPYETYEEFLRALFRNRYEFARNNLPIVKIIMQEIPFHEELRETFKRVATESVLPRFQRVTEAAKEKGILKADIPVPSMIRFIVSSMLGLVITLLVIQPESGLDEQEELEQTIGMIMHGIAANPAPEGG